MSRETNSGLGLALGIITGLTVGAAIAVLYAPSKGEETRRRIRRKIEELTDDLCDSCEGLSDKAKDALGTLKSEYENAKDKAVHKVSGAIESVEKEIDSIKR